MVQLSLDLIKSSIHMKRKKRDEELNIQKTMGIKLECFHESQWRTELS